MSVEADSQLKSNKGMLIILFNAVLLATLLTLSHGLLKWLSVQNAGAGFVHVLMSYWWVFSIAISVYVFIFFYYAYILRFIDISVLYPIYTGLSIIMVFLMGMLYFDESVNIAQVVGCLLIIVGVFLVSGTT